MKYTLTFTSRVSPTTELFYETTVEDGTTREHEATLIHAVVKATARVHRDLGFQRPGGQNYNWQLADWQVQP